MPNSETALGAPDMELETRLAPGDQVIRADPSCLVVLVLRSFFFKKKNTQRKTGPCSRACLGETHDGRWQGLEVLH